MIEGKSSGGRSSAVRVSIGVMLFGILAFSGLTLVACGGTSAPAVPAGALGASTPAATAAPATVTIGPTVTAAVPTAEAIGTTTAPTIQAAATMLAPTAIAAATMAAGSTSTPTAAGQLATAGKAVYTTSCAVCHGDQGQGVIGPALVGPAANFQSFKNAQDLLTFISVMMPKTSPGSLTPQQYMEVTTLILVDDGFVSKDAPINNASFEGISLTRQGS